MPGRAALAVAIFALTCGAVKAAGPECTAWTVRAPLAYDADTIYVFVPELPGPLEKMSVRVRGIDGPEIRGKCDTEKALARSARDRVRDILRNARRVEFCDVAWGKYAARVVADVLVDGTQLSSILLQDGHVRVYEGGPRSGWCE